MSMKRTALLRVLPLLFCLPAAFSLFYAAKVIADNIAMYHDAVWDFIPAVGMIEGDSLARQMEIRLFHHPVPILTSPYSGPYKTWFLAPLVQLLGTSPLVIVMLNAFLGLVYLMALYWALRPLVGRKWALAAFAIPFVDTNLLITTPVDAGITLFQYIFVSLMLGAFFRYLADSRLKHYHLTWLLGGCVLGQKLTALPIVISFMTALVALSFRRFIETVHGCGFKRAVASYFLKPAALFTIPILPYVYYFYKNGFSALFASAADSNWVPFFKGVGTNFTFFSTMFDGWDWYRRLTLDARPELIKTPILAMFGFTAMASFFILYLLSHRTRERGWSTLILSCAAAGSFFLFPAFRGLYRPWHYYVLAPGFYCCVLASVRHVVHWVDEHGGLAFAFRVVLALVVTAGISVSTLHSLGILKEIENHKGICIASPAFYNMYETIKDTNVKLVYAVNYSIAFPIYVVSKGTIRVEDLAWTTLTPAEIDDIIQKTKNNPDAAIVYRYCGCKDSEPQWIGWLNREPDLFPFIKRVESEIGSLSIIRFRDKRQTEYVLARRKTPLP